MQAHNSLTELRPIPPFAGYKETVALPIFEGIPVLNLWEAVPLAGKAIHSHIERQVRMLKGQRREKRSCGPKYYFWGISGYIQGFDHRAIITSKL